MTFCIENIIGENLKTHVLYSLQRKIYKVSITKYQNKYFLGMQ